LKFLKLSNPERRCRAAIPALRLLGGALALLVLATPARAQWTNVVPGIEYAELSAAGPNEVFVVRMSRAEQSVTIDSMIGQGTLIGGRETVSGMVARYDQTLSWWGQEWGARNDVIVGINGSFFDLSTGVPRGGQIVSGWYAKRYGNFGVSGFAWTVNRDLWIRRCVNHRNAKNFVAFAGGASLPIDAINVGRGANALLLYTNHFDSHTHTDSSGTEVLLELTRPLVLMPEPAGVQGTVVEIRANQGSTPVPFDHLVLSATGATGSDLLGNVALGDTVSVSQEITTYESDCNTPDPTDWTKTFAAIEGSFYFLEDTVVQSFTDPGATARHPRTAVAYDDTYVYFLVVDGRSAASVGMSMTELGTFCRDTLGATHGINQDGGGSSAIWVDGSIRNNPSDGSERTVSNGLMMVRVLPKDISTTLYPADKVEAPSGAALRLGPGFNYAEADSAGAGAAGDVLDHEAAGVLATGSYWWKIQFGAQSGWVDESELLRTGGPDRDAGIPPDDGGVTTDAATTDSDSGSASDGGAPSVGGSGSCDCRTSRRGADPVLPFILALCLVWLRRRRRRRRR
jgi:hypothetical protein